jgi:hypothetical protein
MAVSVPVLVEREDRLRRRGREAEARGDLGAALAPQPHEGALGRRPAGEPRQPAEPLARGRIRRHDPRRVLRAAGEAAPVGELERQLDGPVVGLEQRRDARRIAGAPGVLEQVRVVQLGAAAGVQPQPLAERHADQARAQRVPRRLPLGEVEGVRERGEHLAEPDLGPGHGIVHLHPPLPAPAEGRRANRPERGHAPPRWRVVTGA